MVSGFEFELVQLMVYSMVYEMEWMKVFHLEWRLD